ncbi:MAG: DUF2059 domain-containing protein [Acidobacteria bacterium]|nr:DUF2059 domain-containing protein [Acidobacteriota bacterium]
MAFYESPAGKAMLDKMPELMKRSMDMGSDMMGDMQADIKKVLDEASAKSKQQ